MEPVIPHRFLFRYSCPVRYQESLPGSGKRIVDLPEEFRLLPLDELDNAATFGELRLAWNPNGLGIQLRVTGKKHPPVVSTTDPKSGDGLHLWIDTRNTQSIHRASRFCHSFFLSPGKPTSGATTEGAGLPLARQLPIARAREDADLADPEDILVASRILKTGYQLEAWLPSSILHGFDPEANPRLGFYFSITDAELGEQFLSVGRDFPFEHDPSLWATLELVH